MTTTKKPNNLELWDSFMETNPKYTKSFTRAGGFKGTAIDPMYINMRLTEKFGPNGEGWGWEIIDENYIDGTPLKLDPSVKTVIHKICLRIWYKRNGEKCVTGPQFGLTTFIGETSKYIYTDEEHAKKSVTDAVGKCAVSIGVGADVHLGLFDDNKYLKGLKEKYGEANGDKEKTGYTPDKKTMSKAPPAKDNGFIQPSNVDMLKRVAKKAALTESELDSYLKENFKINGVGEVPVDKFSEALNDLKRLQPEEDNTIPF